MTTWLLGNKTRKDKVFTTQEPQDKDWPLSLQVKPPIRLGNCFINFYFCKFYTENTSVSSTRVSHWLSYLAKNVSQVLQQQHFSLGHFETVDWRRNPFKDSDGAPLLGGATDFQKHLRIQDQFRFSRFSPFDLGKDLYSRRFVILEEVGI